MTPAIHNALRTVAFGDLDTGLWGAAVATGAQPAAAVIGAGANAHSAEVDLEGTSSGEAWTLAGEGVELMITALGEPVAGSGGKDPGQDGFDQLCRVDGRITRDGREQEVSTLGVRGTRETTISAGGFASMRDVAVWFEQGDGMALAAFRPAGAKGQDADVVSASVLGPENPGPVEDPRLSTTYAGDGSVSRAGLELWLGGEEDQQMLRRASGEAVGARASASSGDLELQAELFRWHSGGRDGTGLYLLVSRR
jgi:hypothetical protein